MLDVAIRNGYLVDGSGSPWFKADIGIKTGKVVKVGDLSSDDSRGTIDAEESVVCPGFVDMHSHSDFTLLINPKAESKIRQGVTTEVNGNCGDSPAPIKGISTYDKEFAAECKLDLDWSTTGEYLGQLEKQGLAVNVVQLVGHGTVRTAVIGYQNRLPTGEELDEMKELVTQAMEDGAFGLSSGLFYPPGCYADTRELIELCKTVANYGGIYASHTRGEGDPLIEAVAEALEIGEKANIPVEISHHKACGVQNWGKVKETLRMMEEARSRGIEVTCDVYPYVACGTDIESMIPSWAHEGGFDNLCKRLKNVKIRKRLRREMLEGIPGWERTLKQSGWGRIKVIDWKKHKEFEGKTLAEIAELMNVDPFALVFDLAVEKEDLELVDLAMDEEDVCTVMRHPLSMIGSDGEAIAPYGVLGQRKTHPRSYGTYPRMLRKYVKERKVVTVENAIRKMTSLPAQKLGLRDRGMLREGMWADVVVFNPKTVMDKATYEDPNRYPEGIEYVLVNGRIVVDEGEHTGALSGKVLRISNGKRQYSVRN
ncbi:MAG: D-aminoacylase [Candidatus Bathyarchaeota archaeon]